MNDSSRTVQQAGIPAWVGAAIGVVVGAVGMVVLTGGVLGNALLQELIPGCPRVAAGAAIGYVLCGAALILFSPSLAPRLPLSGRRILGSAAAAAALVLGLVRVADRAFDWRIHALAYMAPAAGLELVFLGGALLCALGRPAFAAMQALAVLAVLEGWLSFCRFLYVEGSVPLGWYGNMAIQTAAGGVLLGAGVLCLRPDRGLVALLGSDTLGAAMMRRLLPPALIVPFVLGWIQLEAQRRAWLGFEAGLSLFVLANVAVFGALVWMTAGALHRTHLERRKAQQAVAESERQYRLIFENSPLPKWIFDKRTLRFLAVNRAAQLRYGFSEAEFLAMTIRDIRPPEDLAALEVDLASAEGGGTRSAEWRHRLKDGSVIDVIVTAHDLELGGKSARMVVAQDITERKRAEEKARAQLARLDLLHRITHAIGERQDLASIFQVVVRSLEDHLPVDFCCMCLYDPLDHGLTVEQIGVRSLPLAQELAMTERAKISVDENGLSRCVGGRLVREPDLAQLPFPFPRRLAAAGLRSAVFAPLLGDSRVFGVLIAGRLTPDAFTSGECEFLRQLSEHTALAANQAQLHAALQQAYDDLRQTQQAVMQQERLRALGQMASGIAHDVNNAISPAALYAESLLEQEQGLAPKSREKLETIQRALEDVAQTVARMREFYRQREQQLSLEHVDLNLLVDQVVNLTRARWQDMPQQRGVVVRTMTTPAQNLPLVLGVESEIREALINLVFNAVDAMPQGGTLALRTRAAGQAPLERAEVEVVDSGLGMDEETKRRCLEPFFTTKGERGTGLGLAMVYGMAQRHGADLHIDSAPGQGTIVRLSFAAAPHPSSGKYEPAAAARPRTRLRLLIVDDDPLLIKSLRDTLESDGHLVVAANGGQAGIDAFRAAIGRGEPFAAVVTDLGMPYVDGRKVASDVKAASPETPVILLTGWGQRLVAEGERPPHVDRVLAKPPKLRELREALAQCETKTPS